MKRLMSALALCALAACGGGGSGAVTPPTKPISTTSVAGTMSFVVAIPLPGTVVPQSLAASSTTRTPQSLAPQTSFILVDLQNNTNPAFENTFTITPAACPVSGGFEECTFTMSIPAGDPTTQLWSIVAGSGKPDGTGTMLSVAHSVPPCFPFPCQGTPTLTVFLNLVVANVQTEVLGWTAPQFTFVTPPLPLFSLVALDAFGNSIRGQFGADAPLDSISFANPFTLSINDPSGQISLNQINGTDLAPLLGNAAFTTQTYVMLGGPHGGVEGIVLLDQATAPRTFTINYSVPEVDLTSTEFPQLTKTWVSPAKTGAIMQAECVPPSGSPPAVQPLTCQTLPTNTAFP